MKQHIIPALRLTFVCILLFMGIYPLLILVIAQAAPAKGAGETMKVNGQTVGYLLEGQNFTSDQYFNSRPSAVSYNAAGSGGSNKGPSNPGYLADVQNRIDSFLVHNPGIVKETIPADLITASGSGLDPDISLQGAKVQAARIARIRHIPEEKINTLIQQHIERSVFNGIEKINVLSINIALDELK